jgi:hypothetical protein
MTRLICFVTACALTGVVTGAAIVACGRPGSPGELPPMAPRPGPADPTAVPVLRRPSAGSNDAGSSLSRRRLSPGPVTMGSSTSRIPVPEFAPVVGEPVDAGTDDGYSPPLPPLPDGNLPADGRMEPRLRE